MKKILLLLCAMLLTVGAWATTVTVTLNDKTELSTITNKTTAESAATHKYGTYSGGETDGSPWTTFTTNADAGLAGATLTSSGENLKATYYSSGNYKFCIAFAPSSTDEFTLTLAAPSGYYITGYSINAISTSYTKPFKITPEGGSTTTISSSLQTISSTTTVSNTVNFTVSTTTTGGELCFPSFTMTVAKIEDVAFTGTGYSVNSTTAALSNGNTAGTWFSTCTLNDPALTLTVGSNNMAFSTDGYLDIHSAGTPTYTLTAPEGYVINGYTMEVYAGATGSYITPSGMQKVAVGTSSDNPTPVVFTGLNSTSTTFTRTGTSTNGYLKTFVVYLSQDFSSLVASDITPWYSTADQYFSITSTAKSALETAGYTAALTSCDLAKYNELKAIVDNSDNYKYPATGFYRIKSNGTRIGESYIGYGQPSARTAGLITVTSANAPADLSTVLYFSKDANGYTISTQGLNVQSQTAHDTAFPCTTEAGATFNFTLISPGLAGIYNSASANGAYYAGYFHEAGWTVPGVVNWNANGSTASYWYVEDAKTATVVLNDGGDGSYYATLCVPFSFTVSGATAYTIAVSGTEATATEVSEVAAGTPVLLKGSAATATLTIGTGYAASALGTTSLTGTYLATTITAADYVLGSDNNVVGFYLWDQTALGANRAYVKSPSGVKGFAINWGETGISTLVAPEAEQVIYNLAGQRVSKATKGIYIINGKKVLK